jgi:hypothetical protein
MLSAAKVFIQNTNYDLSSPSLLISANPEERYFVILFSKSPRWCSGLILDPRVAVSNPAEAVDFSRAIKISSATSFGWELKPEAPCRKILHHVKITFNVNKKCL